MYQDQIFKYSPLSPPFQTKSNICSIAHNSIAHHTRSHKTYSEEYFGVCRVVCIANFAKKKNNIMPLFVRCSMFVLVNSLFFNIVNFHASHLISFSLSVSLTFAGGIFLVFSLKFSFSFLLIPFRIEYCLPFLHCTIYIC